MQAVYRAIGYYSDNLAGLPFDLAGGVVPNDGGRVIDIDGEPMPGAYVTGWIKRGPVGLIGHTKSDAAQTVDLLLSDLGTLDAARDSPSARPSTRTSRAAASTSRPGRAGRSSTPTSSPSARPTSTPARASRSSPRDEMVRIARA